MRKREDIKEEVIVHDRSIPALSSIHVINDSILEVLLDIRELLEDIKEGRRE